MRKHGSSVSSEAERSPQEATAPAQQLRDTTASTQQQMSKSVAAVQHQNSSAAAIQLRKTPTASLWQLDSSTSAIQQLSRPTATVKEANSITAAVQLLDRPTATVKQPNNSTAAIQQPNRSTTAALVQQPSNCTAPERQTNGSTAAVEVQQPEPSNSAAPDRKTSSSLVAIGNSFISVGQKPGRPFDDGKSQDSDMVVKQWQNGSANAAQNSSAVLQSLPMPPTLEQTSSESAVPHTISTTALTQNPSRSVTAEPRTPIQNTDSLTAVAHKPATPELRINRSVAVLPKPVPHAQNTNSVAAVHSLNSTATTARSAVKVLRHRNVSVTAVQILKRYATAAQNKSGSRSAAANSDVSAAAVKRPLTADESQRNPAIVVKKRKNPTSVVEKLNSSAVQNRSKPLPSRTGQPVQECGSELSDRLYVLEGKLDQIFRIIEARSKFSTDTASDDARFRHGRGISFIQAASKGHLLCRPEKNLLFCDVCSPDPEETTILSEKGHGVFLYDFSLGTEFSYGNPLPSQFKLLRLSVRRHFNSLYHRRSLAMNMMTPGSSTQCHFRTART